MIVGLTADLKGLAGEREGFIDGENAVLWVDPTPKTRQNFAERIKAADRASQAWAEFAMRPAVTADGVRIAVCLNIADPSEIELLDPASCDGIGLVRTEFLFSGRKGLPDEQTQYQRLSATGRVGGRQAGYDPHPRRRRGQANRRTDVGARE